MHRLDQVRERLFFDVDPRRHFHKQRLLRRERLLQRGDIFRHTGEQNPLPYFPSHRFVPDALENDSFFDQQHARPNADKEQWHRSIGQRQAQKKLRTRSR